MVLIIMVIIIVVIFALYGIVSKFRKINQNPSLRRMTSRQQVQQQAAGGNQNYSWWHPKSFWEHLVLRKKIYGALMLPVVVLYLVWAFTPYWYQWANSRWYWALFAPFALGPLFALLFGSPAEKWRGIFVRIGIILIVIGLFAYYIVPSGASWWNSPHIWQGGHTSHVNVTYAPEAPTSASHASVIGSDGTAPTLPDYISMPDLVINDYKEHEIGCLAPPDKCLGHFKEYHIECYEPATVQKENLYDDGSSSGWVAGNERIWTTSKGGLTIHYRVPRTSSLPVTIRYGYRHGLIN